MRKRTNKGARIQADGRETGGCILGKELIARWGEFDLNAGLCGFFFPRPEADANFEHKILGLFRIKLSFLVVVRVPFTENFLRVGVVNF